jgi:hypothetical protein
VYRRFPEKCFIYHDDDNAVAVLRAIYPSIRDEPGRFLTPSFDCAVIQSSFMQDIGQNIGTIAQFEFKTIPAPSLSDLYRYSTFVIRNGAKPTSRALCNWSVGQIVPSIENLVYGVSLSVLKSSGSENTFRGFLKNQTSCAGHTC